MPPKIQATRSNLATATNPQLRPPTSTSAAAARSSFFTVYLPYRCCTETGTVAALFRLCQDIVQMLYSRLVTETGHLRIGELSRRAGVSPELLRAWERRYGLLRPAR